MRFRSILVLVLLALFVSCASAATTFPKYSLKLLMHNDLEIADGLSTSLLRDSSDEAHMPFFAADGTYAYNLNTSAPKYGNASAWLYNRAMINVSDSADWTLRTNNYTICGWYTFRESGTGAIFFEQGLGTSSQKLTTDGVNFVWSAARPGDSETITGSLNPAANIPYCLCVVQNGTTTSIYVNGTVSANTSHLIDKTDIAAPIMFGRNTTASSGIRVDEVFFINGAALPAEQLMNPWALYVNGSANGYADDNSTVSLLHFDGANGGTIFKDQYANRTWTAAGSAITSANWSKWNTAYSVKNPSPSYLTTTGTDLSVMDYGTGDFGIDMWVNVTTAPTSVESIFGRRYNLNNYESLGLKDASHLEYFFITGGTYRVYIACPFPTGLNIPHHIYVGRNGTTPLMYIDGVQQAVSVTTAFNGALTLPAGSQTMVIGSHPHPSLLGQYNFTGDIEELRVTKGLARWTAGFTPPPTPYELITNTSFTETPEAAGTVPATIIFNGTDPSGAWTQNGYLWEFGDGATSTERNASHTYSTTGQMNVTFHVLNNNMTERTTQNVPIGLNVDYSATPLAGTAALTVIFTDLTTNVSPITSYLMDFGDGSSSTDTPPWTHVYSTYGAFSPNLTVSNTIGSGFKYKRDYVVVSTEQGNLVESYTPWDVRIRVVDYYGKPLPGTTVTANYVASTLPNTSTKWLVKAFSIDADVAADMVNSDVAYTGTADDTGGLSFSLFKDIQYRFTITNTTSGVSSTKTLYPSDQEYVIYVRTTGQVANNNTLSTRTAALPWYSLNNTHISLNVSYKDTTGCTSGLLYRVWFRDNGTEVHNQTWAGSTGWINDSHIITKAPIGTEYLWQYNASTIC